jgi:ParB family chromosome partitioning protein
VKLKKIPINKIKPNPLQPREYFDREKIKELADSIKEVNLLQPISVRPKGKYFEIISGERRWKACQIVGMKKIPAIIKNVDDGQLMVESLIENIHREDLSDTEKAKALKIIMKKEGIKTLNELAKKVGITQSHISAIFDAAEMRKELDGPSKEVSFSVIAETSGLPKEVRKKVIEIAIKKDFGGRKVRKLVSVIKKAPLPLKKEIFEKELEPEIAEKKLKEWKIEPSPTAEAFAKEIVCPICKTKLLLIHRYPKGHKVEEAV